MAVSPKGSIARSHFHDAKAVGRSMRAVAGAMAMLTMAGLLAGCATGLLGSEDRARLCRVAVAVPTDPYTLRANPLANPAGGVTGAGIGALVLVFATPMLLAVPMIVGHGMQCAASSISHPNAAADFQAIYRSASGNALARGLEQEIEKSRAQCALSEPPHAHKPETLVEVQGIEVTPGCAYDNWEYRLVVTWRVRRADTGATVAETKTQCLHATNREVDDWFAHPEEGRAEFERVLTVVGKRMAEQLVADRELQACITETLKGSEIVLR